MPERTRGRPVSRMTVWILSAACSVRGLGLDSLAVLLIRLQAGFARQRHPQPRDPAAVHLGDPQPRDPTDAVAVRVVEPAAFDGVTNLGQPTQDGHHVARDRLVRTFGQLDAGLVLEVVEAEQAVDVDIATLEAARVRVLRVVLVLDVT